jgi:hypothetical protein
VTVASLRCRPRNRDYLDRFDNLLPQSEEGAEIERRRWRHEEREQIQQARCVVAGHCTEFVFDRLRAKAAPEQASRTMSRRSEILARPRERSGSVRVGRRAGDFGK